MVSLSAQYPAEGWILPSWAHVARCELGQTILNQFPTISSNVAAIAFKLRPVLGCSPFHMESLQRG